MFFQNKKTKFIAAILVIAITFSLVLGVTADAPYMAYDYDWWGDTYPVQSGYVVDRVITSNDLELSPPLRAPADVFIYEAPDGEVMVFLVDTNNHRIVITDEDFKDVRILKDFIYSDDYRVQNFLPREPGKAPISEDYADENGIINVQLYEDAAKTYDQAVADYHDGVEKYWAEVDKIGTETDLKNPTGIHVVTFGDEIRVYIADHNNERVIACDLDGNIWMEYTRPITETFDPTASFRPSKVVTDNAGNVYVCLTTITKGAVVFNEEGDFTGYFGANRVTKTIDAIFNKFLRLVLTREQMELRTQPVPVEFSNFTVDSDQFIYTVTETRSADIDIVKKLDPAGRNVFEKEGLDNFTWGDFMSPYAYGKYYTSMIIDISVDDKGDIYIFDRESGKIFQYDKEGHLMFVFGGKGDQKGMFITPTALETHNGKVYALDSNKNTLTVFKLTEFGDLVLDAMNLFNRGLYKESLEPWQEVMKRDSNYYMAYVGMGNAKLSIGEFKESLDYFYRHEWHGYGRAFKDFRIHFIRENFDKMLAVTLIVIAILIGTNVAIKIIRKHKKAKA